MPRTPEAKRSRLDPTTQAASAAATHNTTLQNTRFESLLTISRLLSQGTSLWVKDLLSVAQTGSTQLIRGGLVQLGFAGQAALEIRKIIEASITEETAAPLIADYKQKISAHILKVRDSKPSSTLKKLTRSFR